MLCFCSSWLKASAPPLLESSTSNALELVSQGPIDLQFERYADTERAYPAERVADLLARGEAGGDKGLVNIIWELVDVSENSGVNAGYTLTPQWYRFKISNSSDKVEGGLVQLAYPWLDEVDFIDIRGEEGSGHLSTGRSKPFSSRWIDHPHFLYPISLDPGESTTIYLRVATRGALQFALKLWDPEQFFEQAVTEAKVHFMYFGALAFMITITLAYALLLRERVYLYYAFATFGFLTFFMSIRGFTFQHILSDFPFLNGFLLLVSMPFLAIFAAQFSRTFLDTEAQSRRLDLALKTVMGLAVLDLIAAFILPYHISIQLSSFLAAPLFLILFLAGPIRWRQGSRPAIIYTLGWSLLSIGLVTTTLHKHGIIPNTFMATYALQIGSGIETLILTLVLAARVYREREDKIVAQNKLLAEEKQRREVQQQLIDHAIHDPVTGLPNRERLVMRLAELAQAPQVTPYLVVSIVFNRYHDIVHTLGQDNADELINRVALGLNRRAQFLRGAIAIEDSAGQTYYVASLGADTLAMIVISAEDPAHRQTYIDFINRTARPDNYLGFLLELDPVFGLFSVDSDQLEPAKAIRNSRIAKDAAIRLGKRYGFYSRRYDRYTEERLTILTELRLALETGALQLYYQPKAIMRDGRLVTTGVEALLRWEHPERGMIAPEIFIPLAEQTDVIHQLTLWVITNAADDLTRFRLLQRDLSMAINISPRNLLTKGLDAHLQSTLLARNLSFESVILELTETSVMDSEREGLLTLDRLKELGFPLSIDDFGTGYSSLAYLQKMPLSEVKIDKSLIKDVCTSRSSQIIVKAAIDMSHSLGYTVVAEGIEQQAQLDLLVSMGCDCMQGFFIATPMPSDQLFGWLQQDSERMRPTGAG
ncbi:EAL domain-containing protein [Allohahella marinimesophila]|uniref:EAL domain-containing protein n=1 Tax=Allohahella marinimesophila TaxID=1054972 RepID=A0ABP7PL57_9GAMM